MVGGLCGDVSWWMSGCVVGAEDTWVVAAGVEGTVVCGGGDGGGTTVDGSSA